MGPIKNPFSAGAGSPLPELAGREGVLEEVKVLLGRIKTKRPAKSLLLTGTAIPDFSSISRRSVDLPRFLISKAMKPGSVVIVDSTGLNVYRKDKWHKENHALPARRTWLKLHLAVDEKHQVMGCELATPAVRDPAAVPDLLAQVPPGSEIFMGNGAYDGDLVLQAVQAKQPNATVNIHRTRRRSAQALASVTNTSPPPSNTAA